jgi:hypothetical protein
MRPPLAALPIIVAGLGWTVLYRLGRGYGAVPAERSAPLPGDRVIRRPDVVCTHATTINAPPQQVWPWLQQVGWHRGGWYTARWVDRLLFPDHWASADELLPNYRQLTVGDFIPDGAPETGCGFTVEDLQPERYLLLHSTTHLPRSWREGGIAALDWTWVFLLHPVDGGARTRFVFRWRGWTHPWWLRLMFHAVIVPADFLMSRDMLSGLRQRAERTAPSTTSRSFSGAVQR